MGFLQLAIPIAFALLAWRLLRAGDLFELSVRDGKVLLVRGRIPPSLLEALADVVKRARVTRATVRVRRAGQAVRLTASGTDELVTQRLRNVVGTYPAHKLGGAPSPREQNLGQRLGIAWLAWLLHDSRSR